MGQSFKDVVAWQRAMQLTLAVDKLTAGFPDTERFGLTNQMRRAAVSVASNIAEGYGRSTKGEYVLFLGHARGSCCELETQILIERELRMGTPENLEATSQLCDDVGRLLGALMKSLRSGKSSSPLVPQSLSPSSSQELALP
jgi:four helix bundle protein